MRGGKDTNPLAVAVINALTSHICVLDQLGTIIAVNNAWRDYGASNSWQDECSGIGTNYLAICQSVVGEEAKDASAFHAGILSVLNGEQEYFQLEYPCHSSTEERWFLARVSPLCSGPKNLASGRPSGAVVSHANITERKVLEAKLSRMAATDYLTGLSNRREFVNATKAALPALLSTGRSASLLMFDVDDFKSINDLYGHQAGDEALRVIASTCRSVFRDGDLVARIGGEEFACFMPDTDIVEASLVAERLRQQIAAECVRFHSNSLKVTVSIGISTIPSEGATLDQMLSGADKAMYRAKRDGRNCVRIHEFLERSESSAA